ncbi:MAG: redox-sensitive bicupin YhaK (pirin superfamily) [Cellvibrionaceae bacterium]
MIDYRYPKQKQLAVYVASGSIVLAGQQVPQFSMAILKDNATASIESTGDSQIAIIGGDKMSERFIE